MTPDQIAYAQNALSAFGILLLSVPAFSLNRRKKALERIRSIISKRNSQGDGSALDSIALALQERRQDNAGRWHRMDELCLYIGYFSLLGASLWRLF